MSVAGEMGYVCVRRNGICLCQEKWDMSGEMDYICVWRNKLIMCQRKWAISMSGEME